MCSVASSAFSLQSTPVVRVYAALYRQLLTYPLDMYVVRHAVDTSVFQTLLGMGPIISVHHYGITVGVWGLTMMLSLSTANLGVVMEILGAFSVTVSVQDAIVVPTVF